MESFLKRFWYWKCLTYIQPNVQTILSVNAKLKNKKLTQLDFLTNQEFGDENFKWGFGN